MRTGVPTALTSFVGRQHEMEEIGRLLREHRLVTLSGIGGAGKTRLAARLCAEADDKVCWVDLSPIADPEVIPRIIANALDVLLEPGSDPLPVLAGALRDRRLLLCLDTCEHLIDVTAELTRTLLLACPGVSVLATSRAPLGVPGEVVWRVPPLRADEASRLFADRAALVAPEFSADRHTTEVHAVCRRVDGIPLAVELAAAWVSALSPGQIAAGLADSVRLLTGEQRGTLPRHQTLTASMDWSHELLDDAERAAFRRLSVFAGSFTLPAAEVVCGPDVLPLLRRLLDKSLIVLQRGGPEVRYRLLDTVRQYGHDRLRDAGELGEARDAHLDHFLALAERAEPELERDQDTWRQLLDSHRDDIAAGVRWGLAAPPRHERGRRLCAAMARQWFIRGQAAEGLDYVRAALDAAPDDRSAVQARLLAGQAILAMAAGRRELCGSSAAAGMELATETGDEKTRARCLVMAAYHQFFIDFDRCEQLSAAGSRLGAETGEPFARDFGAVVHAYTFNTRDRHDEAVALARPAFEASMPRGDRLCAALARGVEVYAEMWGGDVRAACEFAADAADIIEPLDDYFAVGTTTTHIAEALGMAGDIDGGRKALEPIARSIDRTPDADAVGYMVPMGEFNLWSGNLHEAVFWFERGTSSPGAAADRWTATRCLPGLAAALRHLGRLAEAAERAAEGTELARSYGTDYYLSLGLDELGFLAADTDLARAAALHHEALAVRRGRNLRTLYVNSLDALAGVALRAERHTEAARLFAASDAAREDIGYPRRPVDLPAHEAAIASLEAALPADELRAATAEGAQLTLEEAVAGATRGRGHRQRPPSGWTSLTPTELDVVRLVVDGLTNPEIGQRLFITRATVKTHLSHVYTKLDVRSRVALVNLARRHQDGA